MPTKTLGNKKNNRYVWEKGHIKIDLRSVKTKKSKGKKVI